uniref:NADH-ubiquinone oxidoreductase chain 4 n=1 Tax=Dermacentor reticulatus TaxID=57047 RepID=A0A6N0A0M4_DERRT|nr:NADH dehydrogenase subunit 4 [Dermacentor reticulatus]QKN99278.1 NADH dehydrogenase subunit 4 [Dermacentor reticulatus]UZG91451.1 NADH dehydrogenase subunit 4 [Dermacentor reticulatus]UZG91464.1 NADH dehydrogenase subunit 4 [Dermacentor reticulatus]UZG91490.1 NADH dehydrogenase subunit 4 [Dermacentor reticulatus]UZG91503.1 NADH dehydrogenase subunit 4 [Dermacentor reticulatus]
MLKLLSMSILIMCLIFQFNSYQMIIYLLMLSSISVLLSLLNSGDLISNYFFLDLLSFSMIQLSIWITFLMMIASTFLNMFKNKFFVFYVMMMMNMLVLCFSSMNLLMFYLFFESVLFPIIMMILKWGNQPERIQAGFYMLMYTIFGSLPLLVLIILNKISLNIIYNEWIYGQMNLFFFLMVLGFLVKIPMFFFHLWLPKAHVEAPISGSMMLAGVLLKLGFYGIYRFKSFFFLDLKNMAVVLMIISIWGAVIISMACLFQIDIKALIAYSSVSHMGISLAGCLTFNSYGSYGTLMMMIGHGLCSSGLFCLANMIYERFFTRNMLLIKGMIMIFPNLVLWWFLFSIFNMSAPLTMNLFGELFLSAGLIKYSMFFSFPIIILIFLSACYTIYMYSYINHGSGWMMFSNFMISEREYFLLLMHFMPMVFWIMKIDFFMKFI